MKDKDHTRRHITKIAMKFSFVVAGILFLIGCGQVNVPKENASVDEEITNDSNEETATSHEIDRPVPDETYVIGDVMNIGDLVMTINSIEDSTLDEDKPYIKEGERGLIIDVTVVNNGLDEFLLSSGLFSLFSEEGKDYNTSLLGLTLDSIDGIFEPGIEKSGHISFIVPETATGLMLYYNHFDVINKDPLHTKTIMIELGQ